MATTIKLKNGSGAPTAGDLVQGEPALDLTNKRLYTEDSGGTVIEVGTNPTSVTTGDITATGTATFAGLTTTADVSFGDNDKAIFGAGSDLQIYHNGSHNFIEGVNAGNIYIRNGLDDGDVIIQSDNGSGGFANYIQADGSNGEVRLFHYGSEKLNTTSTGIDVTGTVTADSATIEGGLTVSSTFPTITFTDTDSNPDYQLRSANGYFQVYDSTNAAPRFLVGGNGDISFYEDTGTTAKFFWDASQERLELDSANAKLLVLERNGGTDANVSIEFNCATNNWYAGTNPANNFAIGTNLDQTNAPFQINASGKVTVSSDTGSASPTATELRIGSSSTGGDWSLSDKWGVLGFYSADSSGSGAGNRAEISVNMETATGAYGSVDFTLANPGASYTQKSWLKLQNSGASANRRVDIEADGGLYVNKNVEIGSQDTGTASSKQLLSLVNPHGNTGAAAQLWLSGTNATTRGAYIEAEAQSSANQHDLIFATSAVSAAPTERMRIDSSGNVGIGSSTPNYLLDVEGSGSLLRVNATSGNSIQQFSVADTTSLAGINFGDSGSTTAGQILYRHNGDSMAFNTAGSEAMRIDQSGNLLVGKTASSLSTAGHQLFPSGAQWSTVSNARVLLLNRLSSDGDIAEFRKDGTTVGSIGSIGGVTSYIDGGSSYTGLAFNASSVAPRDAGAGTNGTVDLGASSARFKDLYLSGGAYLGGTAAANKLDDYEEGTFTPTLTFGGADTGNVYGSQSGRYIKVGNVVHAFVYVRLTTLGTATGNAEISGLPFTANSSSEQGGSVGYFINLSGLTSTPIARASGTLIELRDTDSSSATRMTHGNFTGTSDIRLQITYEV